MTDGPVFTGCKQIRLHAHAETRVHWYLIALPHWVTHSIHDRAQLLQPAFQDRH